MSKLKHFFYELPSNPQYPDAPDAVVLSGYWIKGTPRDVYPFGFANIYRLDDRSQALIGQETVTVPDTDLVENAPDDTRPADTPQLQLDFDAPIAGKAQPKPEPRDLVLEMCRGELLGKTLKAFSKKHDAEFVTLTPQGIATETASIAYPKGVTAKGIGIARIRSECLWRLLGGTPPKPSFPVLYKGRYASPADPVRGKNHFCGIGKDYTHITINGTVEIQSGTFTVRIPTETE